MSIKQLLRASMVQNCLFRYPVYIRAFEGLIGDLLMFFCLKKNPELNRQKIKFSSKISWTRPVPSWRHWWNSFWMSSLYKINFDFSSLLEKSLDFLFIADPWMFPIYRIPFEWFHSSLLSIDSTIEVICMCSFHRRPRQ